MFHYELIIVMVALAQTPPTGTDHSRRVPAVLERAILQRADFKTAAISYRRVWENQRFGRQVDNNDVRIAESAEYVLEKGDDDGILSRDMKTGQANFGVRNMCHPREHLFDPVAGTWWSHWNSYETFDLKSAASWTDRVDLRTVGLECHENQRVTPSSILEEMKRNDAIKFSQSKAGENLVRVTATEPVTQPSGGYMESEWVIDTSKGPSVVSAAQWYHKPGEPKKLMAESQTTLTQADGRWWPALVEFRYPEGPGSVRYEFKLIEFDRESHPKRLDVDFLGIPAGAIVYNVLETPTQPKQQRYIGEGRTVSVPEWKAMEDQFEKGPLIEFNGRMQALGPGYFPKWWDAPEGDFEIEGLPDRPDLWEAYVRRWVMRNTTNNRWVVIEPLTDSQKAAAQGVLSDCRKKAVPIRARCDAEVIPVRSELAALAVKLNELAHAKNGTSQPANSQEDVVKAQIEAVRLRISKLERPKEIASIFEELKTRLDAILTTKQRDPANGAFEKPVAKAVKRPDGLFEYITSTERQSTRKP